MRQLSSAARSRPASTPGSTDRRTAADRGTRRSERGPNHEKRGLIHAFLGAAFLTGVLLLPHARALPIGCGIVLAGLIQFGWRRVVR